MTNVVKCPACQKQVEWIESSSFRPFCSDRCRLIDLGDWASEKHAIADEQLASSEEPLYFKNDKPDKF